MPIVKVNGREVEFEPGMTVLQVAELASSVTLGLVPRVHSSSGALASPWVLGTSPRMTAVRGAT